MKRCFCSVKCKHKGREILFVYKLLQLVIKIQHFVHLFKVHSKNHNIPTTKPEDTFFWTQKISEINISYPQTQTHWPLCTWDHLNWSVWQLNNSRKCLKGFNLNVKWRILCYKSVSDIFRSINSFVPQNTIEFIVKLRVSIEGLKPLNFSIFTQSYLQSF